MRNSLGAYWFSCIGHALVPHSGNKNGQSFSSSQSISCRLTCIETIYSNAAAEKWLVSCGSGKLIANVIQLSMPVCVHVVDRFVVADSNTLAGAATTIHWYDRDSRSCATLLDMRLAGKQSTNHDRWSSPCHAHQLLADHFLYAGQFLFVRWNLARTATIDGQIYGRGLGCRANAHSFRFCFRYGYLVTCYLSRR